MNTNNKFILLLFTYITSFLFIFLFFSISAHAQLSQLDFNKSEKKVNKNFTKRARLKRLPSPTVKSSITPKITTAIIPLERDFSHIIPRLKGPYTDKGNKQKITTNKSWTTPGDCTYITNEKTLQNKSNALKELLFRFTGSDKYFTSQKINCTNYCYERKKKGILTGLSLYTGDNGAFRIKKIKNSCHYELTKDPMSSWHSLDGSKMTCQCISLR